MPRARKSRRPNEFGGVVMLVAGVVIGSLSTILWQGAHTPDGFGAGIRRMVDGFFDGNAPAKTPPKPLTPKISTNYEFFTVLPGLEVLVPPPPPKTKSPAQQPPAVQAEQVTPRAQTPAASGSFILQAASYGSIEEADRLKATLALAGLKSKIQKVSIQGRGDFYRVRLGPYSTYEKMQVAHARLVEAGIEKPLPLKVSTP